jgi:DNA-binding transcriptional ArsR family regulator
MRTPKPNSDELATWMKALSSPARVRIAQMIETKALCVSAIAARLEMSQPAVSQHLRVLRHAGLVIPEKRGYYVHYRLNKHTLARCLRVLHSLVSGPRRNRHNQKR